MRILAIAVLAGSMLHAAEVLHVRDEGADAFFQKTDGCIVSAFQVSVSATTLKVPSAPEQQQSLATLAIGRFNVCTGVQPSMAAASSNSRGSDRRNPTYRKVVNGTCSPA